MLWCKAVIPNIFQAAALLKVGVLWCGTLNIIFKGLFANYVPIQKKGAKACVKT
jgi:hypothetical protein